MFGSGSILFSVLAWSGGVISTIFWGTLSVIFSFFPRAHKNQHFCVRMWSRWCCWSSRTRVVVDGLENAMMDKPQIFAANHQAIYDILILGGWIPTSYRWIVRKEWFRTPFMGWHLARSGNIAIDRANPRVSAQSLREAVEKIKAGANVLFFPEGTRHKEAILQEFKPGGFVLALRAGVPIVPVTIVGTKEIIRKNSWRVHKGTIRLTLGTPIDTTRYGKHERDRLMHDVEDAIAAHLPPESRVTYEQRKANRERTDGSTE
jgi:1-acyl-sn-glycerol-3-phosphate acyltransferase